MPIPPCDPALLADFQRDGFVVIRGVLRGAELAAAQDDHRRLLDEAMAAAGPGRRVYEATRIIERGAGLRALMDHPAALPLLRAVIGADLTLAAAGQAYLNPAGSQAFIGWHGDFQWMVDVPYPRQNFWVRATWLIDDVDEDTGPMTVLPGTHRLPYACPEHELNRDGQPLPQAGAVPFTGRAGDLWLNHTELWHTNTSNRGVRDRRLAMLTYKHAWMRPWGDGHEVSPEFAAAQTDPLRRQLCGADGWHRIDRRWAA